MDNFQKKIIYCSSLEGVSRIITLLYNVFPDHRRAYVEIGPSEVFR